MWLGMDLILDGHYNPIDDSVASPPSGPLLCLQTGHRVPLTAMHSHTSLPPTVGLSPLQKTAPQNPPNK